MDVCLLDLKEKIKNPKSNIMKDLLLIGVILASVVFLIIQHLFNWAWRVFYDKEMRVPLVFFYLIAIVLYYSYLMKH
jgi:hypothetical protein